MMFNRAFFSIQNGLFLVKANTLKRKAIFLIGVQFISGLSEHEARKLEQSPWARSANARATPGWPANLYGTIKTDCHSKVEIQEEYQKESIEKEDMKMQKKESVDSGNKEKKVKCVFVKGFNLFA